MKERERERIFLSNCYTYLLLASIFTIILSNPNSAVRFEHFISNHYPYFNKYCYSCSMQQHKELSKNMRSPLSGEYRRTVMYYPVSAVS